MLTTLNRKLKLGFGKASLKCRFMVGDSLSVMSNEFHISAAKFYSGPISTSSMS